MKHSTSYSSSYNRWADRLNVEATASIILSTQNSNGEIPWYTGGKTDPWDHVESAMGLCIAGYIPEARAAYYWLANNQLKDGSWYSAYKDSCPIDKTRESNMASYIAVGLNHYFLITQDFVFLQEMWPTLNAAIDFSLKLQTPNGEIHWGISPEEKIDPMALLTGCSSIYMSLKCALFIAHQLKIEKPEWKIALLKLGDALQNKPYLFNMTKSRYSMDWFYPILCGAIQGENAQKRIEKYWKKFVVKDLGIRCVSDEPWVTLAETSELVLALKAMGNHNLSSIIFSWIQDKQFEDESYWSGFTFPDIILWPEEKFTWTNAVILMAADALYNLTPAGHLFNHQYWETHLSRILAIN